MNAPSKEQLAAALKQAQPNLSDNADYDILVKAFVDEFAVASSHAQAGALGALVKNYAIRTDEIKLFDTIAATITTAAGAGFLIDATTPHEKVITAKVSIAVGLFKFIKNIWNKGVVLKDDDAKILSLLKHQDQHNEGLTLSEIHHLLQARKIEIDKVQLKDILKSMTEVGTRDGGTTKLVRLDSRRRWHADV